MTLFQILKEAMEYLQQSALFLIAVVLATFVAINQNYVSGCGGCGPCKYANSRSILFDAGINVVVVEFHLKT